MNNGLDIRTGSILCAGPGNFQQVTSAEVSGDKIAFTYVSFHSGESVSATAGHDDYFDIVMTAEEWEALSDEKKAAYLTAIPDPITTGDDFGKVIDAYTRAQALADGVLVDVTSIAQNAGWKIPVALTQPLNAGLSEKSDYAGDVWFVLWMANHFGKYHRDEETFTMYFRGIPGHDRIRVSLGDDDGMVLTIGFPEDF